MIFKRLNMNRLILTCMTQISIDIRKTVEENAAYYFEQAKKAKRKLAGIDATIRRFRDEMAELEQKKEIAAFEEKKKQAKAVRKKEWYEKFHWFISSEGFLCIGGRDATSNEVVVKKHTDKNDLVFHTEAPGSPFFVIKTEGKKPGEATIQEAAQATAIYSRAWKLGIVADVYWVLPEQASKKAVSGEYMPRGAFMIYGKRNYVRTQMTAGVGMLSDGRIMGGPIEAVNKNCEKFVTVIQGDEKPSSAAKKIAKKTGTEDIDAIVAALPTGGVKVVV